MQKDPPGPVTLGDIEGLSDQQRSALEAAGLTTVELIRKEYAKKGTLQGKDNVGKGTEATLVQELGLGDPEPVEPESPPPAVEPEATLVQEGDCLGVYSVEIPGCMVGRQLIYSRGGPEAALEIYKDGAGVRSHYGRPEVAETPLDPTDEQVRQRLFGIVESL